jgi:hypothetical protein
MRRDYFICVFLLCICVSLFYVCFLPLYFIYGSEVVPREFGVLESIVSWVYILLIFIVLPVYAAYKKRFWISAGLAAYGVLASIPVWFLPKMADKLAGEEVTIISVVWAFLLKSVYGMAEAPFAALTPVLGNRFPEALPRWIMPIALLSYAALRVLRYYRNAYIAEQLDPAKALDTTSIESSGTVGSLSSKPVRKATMPEVLGTVISAPGKNIKPPHEEGNNRSKSPAE